MRAASAAGRFCLFKVPFHISRMSVCVESLLVHSSFVHLGCRQSFQLRGRDRILQHFSKVGIVQKSTMGSLRNGVVEKDSSLGLWCRRWTRGPSTAVCCRRTPLRLTMLNHRT